MTSLHALIRLVLSWPWASRQRVQLKLTTRLYDVAGHEIRWN